MLSIAVVSLALVQDCTGTSTGLVPLTDLGSGTYQGYEGGLYPGGLNARPAAHEAAGLDLARNVVQPLGGDGRPDPANGRIVFASIGMSNTTMEFSQFVTLADADVEKSPRLVVVDGAQGGKAANQWADPLDTCWSTFRSRLTGASVTGEQLQVVWIKLTARAADIGAFPGGAEQVAEWIRQAIGILVSNYHNVKIVYLSSRIYAGYATSPLNPEPVACENGFTVKWLVEDYLNGVLPPSPWLSWGPYLWADGLGPDDAPGGAGGRADGLEWLCGDYSADGTHPGTNGRLKVAQILLDWCKIDATARVWFTGQTGGGDPTPAPHPAETGPADGGSGGGRCGATGAEALAILLLLRRAARRRPRL